MKEQIYIKDKNGILMKNGDIIRIESTVNGCSEFKIIDLDEKIAHYKGCDREYEYDFESLLGMDEMLRFGENSVEIIEREIEKTYWFVSYISSNGSQGNLGKEQKGNVLHIIDTQNFISKTYCNNDPVTILNFQKVSIEQFEAIIK